MKLLGDAGQAGLRPIEVSKQLGLTTTTAHRIMTALERHGLVEREQATHRYRLGLSLFAMGAKAADGTGLRSLCRPALMRLAAETGDTVFLMARSGFNVVCVDRQEGTYVLDSLTGHIGGQIPLGVGSASLAVLAFLPEQEARAIVAANARHYAAFNGLSAEEIDAAARRDARAGVRARPGAPCRRHLGPCGADCAEGPRCRGGAGDQHDELAAAGRAHRVDRGPPEGRSRHRRE